MAAQFTRTMPRPRRALSLVHLRGQQLLAGAGLAEEEHRRVRRGHLLDLLHHAAHRRALADNRVGASRSSVVRPRPVNERLGHIDGMFH